MIDIVRKHSKNLERAYNVHGRNIINNLRIARDQWEGTRIGQMYYDYATLEAEEAIKGLNAGEQQRFIELLREDGMPDYLLPLPDELDTSNLS